ncbi:MAG: radical SAM protein [candidate division Zixibacteria bacterium]|nr:radical SAM protein [candidate division Zixibacteria bacterium]
MFKNTELAIMPTFRCNAHCQMCHIWQYPSRREEEIALDDLDKLPQGFARINLGGGEPTLRKDILEMADLLSKKTKHLEISTNGYFTDKLVSIARKHPDIRIRISLEGLPRKNDEIRGIRNGFDRAMRSMLKLKQAGIKDIGFAITISHRNAEELVDLYHLCASMGVEFSQCVVHDAWQFRVPYNVIENKTEVISQIKHFIRELLLSKRKDLSLKVKDWFRAYLNRGFINFIRGDQRLLPCGAGTDIVFIDPYGEVYPCNALKKSMGNIKQKSFEEIWNGFQAQKARKMVSECKDNCWMVGTSRPAMRKNILKPSIWVLKNKLRLLFRKDVIWNMEDKLDFSEKEEIKDKEENPYQLIHS